ncbi:BON domain-containing protein [Ramlibacter sp. USB13]|uniref:BON domain-containing protein n=1 Tax=Ramlibacter cellulosilyticus TaxID=2764187 RepID=A0A923MPH2_9BURK|nr:BON domain-containing protein [Ramlibacter cellulosilyticus]MBC5781834.1 BON domain-containing protein [Ramlibacter cellulosilyticus]
MNKPLATLGAAAAGALAMYYLDPDLGARRRALLADLVRGGLPGEARRVGRGRLARRAPLQVPAGDPRSDAELRDRIQQALDRMVSHPRALHVAVEEGVVRLSGRVLASEREGVAAQVQRMPGVRKLVNATTAHDDPQELTGRRAPVPLGTASR